MGFFDFLFGKKLSIERLVELDQDKLLEELQRTKLKELEKLCLTRCHDLDTEEKQKKIYIDAILNIINEIKAQKTPEEVQEAVADAFESKPVDVNTTEPPMEPSQPPVEPMNNPEEMAGPPGEKPPAEETKIGPFGGRRKKRKGGSTKRKQEKKGGKRGSKKKTDV